MIVAWTGHRPDLFLDPTAARRAVESTAHELARQGAARFLVGGQRGVDTWAALAAIASAVPFRLVLPFDLDTFTQDWQVADRSLLIQTMASADDLHIAGGYSERNQVLARSAELLVAVWTRTQGGGTAETIDLARRAGTPIREIVLEPAAAAGSAHGRGI
jgi:cytosine/adenosine deaminase-related metal-dependent hydrolase